MEYDLDNGLWAMEKVRDLEAMRGFPRTEAGLQRWVKSFLAIVHDQERGQWLLDTIFEGCREFPSMFEVRSIYETRKNPADGIRSDDLGEIMDRAGVR